MPDLRGLYALPPGVDFATEFVAGLLDRMAGQPPESLARVTIFANSAATLAALKTAFDARGPLLLPQLRSVTGLDLRPVADRVPPAPPLRRRLELGQLIARLLETRPDLAAGHSVPELARSLSNLMMDMQTEGLDATALDLIDTGDHARHWQNALLFLRIAAGFHLSAPVADRAAVQRLSAEIAAGGWRDGAALPRGPVIVAGSTGSQGATRLFMQAVAELPNGAVVLPGFDFDQPADIWNQLDPGGEDHPQSRFAPLIRAAGTPQRWTRTAPPVPDRNRLVSLALRPAPVTDQWIADGPGLPDLIAPTTDLTLIEADQPGAEADTIALIMRDAVERGEPVTLIAADAGLIRRVASALDRWHLRPDDSSGRPLVLTAVGLLLRQVAELFGQPLTIDRLLILLKHPLIATGSPTISRAQSLFFTRDLEMRLRARGPAFPDGAMLRDWGAQDDAARRDWAAWLADVIDRAKAFETDRAARPLADRLADLLALTGDLAAGPAGDVAASELWRNADGQMARAVLDHLVLHADAGAAMRPRDLYALLMDEMGVLALRDTRDTHPLLRIHGPREARVTAHGTVILSGLNEGGWPRPLTPDPWLSRQMRSAAGLPLPERQIGLAAHDFQQGIAAERVILTRAKRDADAETIPSRWLNRLLNLMKGLPDRNGPAAIKAMQARGDLWLDRARAVSLPDAPTPPAARPAPIPPAPAFTELPVTTISALIRNPYEVYARRVLGLRALNPLRPEPDAALRGQTLHSIVESLLRSNPAPDTPPDELRDRFLRLTADVLAEQVPWPTARAFWQARMAGIADQIVADELARRQTGRPAVIEHQGRLAVADLGFTLTAKPDRIDLLDDGQAVIYDYKSGPPPSDKQIAHFDKQLMLQAAMTRLGAFDAIGPVDVAGIRYIQLGGGGQTHPRAYSAQDDVDAWAGFIRLMRAYLSGDVGFVAHLAPVTTQWGSDYDHLARLGEWSRADPATPQKVGDHG
ncbi:double-strand break repair protein AddB [Paracoccus sp. (in: a-proteobacteria)]|uniref:double-strand break repair protein AddB n=1 Tax=Paracoccus sp. TaxID=267 RepID=UPI0026DFC3EB|nr:double-strand break repair protein AddB [Paracoccus sp. (in: a-proteobacteria)]MDO5647097.1 double-strand break repair protein AddB [Paracoccus sp. (in: a-proteobacteria)]